jgi:phosphoglycerate dehydrogenase-like enzyme
MSLGLYLRVVSTDNFIDALHAGRLRHVGLDVFHVKVTAHAG